MNILFILNEAPYGNERTYNGIRLAGALAKLDRNEVHLFLLGDAVSSAHRQQKVPTGYYNIEMMLSVVTSHAGVIGVCGTCMDARGIKPEDLVQGAHRSSMDELAQWTQWAEKVLVF